MTTSPITYFRESTAFLHELSGFLEGRRVLEVFAGNGYLAGQLAQRGIDIKATSLFAGHDGHEFGMHHEVQEMEASHAVMSHGADADVLLMSWPIVGPDALRVLSVWGTAKPVVYIGETPRPDLPGISGLPGCASDEFFEAITWDRVFPSYQGNMLEKAGVIYWTGDV